MASRDKELRNWLHYLFCVIVMECIFPTMCTDSLAPSMSYEIIIPRRLEPELGKAKEEELSYIIKAAGQEHIIRLKRKNHFLVENLPVFTYEVEDRKVKSNPYIPTGCYYGGYVEGTADSLVALSTCFGLRGFLKIGDLNYDIEPLGGSRTFQHLLYLTNKTRLISTIGDLRADDPNHQTEAGRGKAIFRFANSPLYIELYVVVDSVMFRLQGSENETRMIYIVLDIINRVDTYYRVLNIAVTLVGLDIWKESNPIKVYGDNEKVIGNFAAWKIAHEKEVERDVTHLFVYGGVHKEIPKSHLEGICRTNISVGIVSYQTENLNVFALTVTHILGQNLGLDPDGPYCVCDQKTSCIMHSTPEFAEFSNCSIASFSRLRMRRRLRCLRNVPTSIFKLKHCGDKVVDAGEQCDCGERQECEEDPCCHPNCTFKAKAECAHEKCCDNCNLTPKGVLCRASVNQCDLPEYCTGKSMQCPVDVYKQDGTPCGKEYHCYAKKCSTLHLHCANIFGEDARAAPRDCFKALNMAGDQVGNCGGDGVGENFVKCKAQDILCGRLHCSNVGDQLSPLTYTVSLVSGEYCWSTKYQHGTDPWDRGAVPDGTTCGKEKICMNQTCVPVSILKSECDPREKCHDNGVCNNHKNCHCYLGWAPPYCIDSGMGGSVDSGPPIQAYSTYLLSMVFKVVIPVILVCLVVTILLVSRMRRFFNQISQ